MSKVAARRPRSTRSAPRAVVVEVLPVDPGEALVRIEPPAGGLVLSAETAAKVEQIFAEGTAPATRLAYASDLRYFQRWAGVTYGAAPWPVPVGVVVGFIVDHLGEGLAPDVERVLLEEGVKAAAGPLSLATVCRRVASLSKAHLLAKVEPNPCRSAEVRELLGKARRRDAAQGRRPAKKKALTRDRLDLLLATCGEDLPGIRDRALLLLAFASGGRRRSEVVAIRAEDLVAEEDGFTFLLRRSKTDQLGEGVTLPVRGRAAAALRAWLDASGVTGGPLFRRLVPIGPGGRGGFKAGQDGLSTGQSVALIVKRRAAAAGLDPRAFAAHSLRSGFLTETGRAGVGLADAMRLSGHRSTRVALGYFEAGDVMNNPAARVGG